MEGFIYVFLQKSTLTLNHNPLKVPTHDRADQNLLCAKAQPLNKRQVKFAHNVQLHQSCVDTRVVIRSDRMSQQATRKPPQGSVYASVDSFNTAITLYGCSS